MTAACGRHMPRLPAHVFFMGPTIVESWAGFEKREAFSFEGQLTAITEMTKQLYGQLKSIDSNGALLTSLRTPAASLLRLLTREKRGAATEFNTLKDLKSPNTWIALPATYPQFLHHESEFEERVRTVAEPEMWRVAHGRTLATSSALMPAIPEYSGVPWAAGVRSINPLKFDQAFDDRHFWHRMS